MPPLVRTSLLACQDRHLQSHLSRRVFCRAPFARQSWNLAVSPGLGLRVRQHFELGDDARKNHCDHRSRCARSRHRGWPNTQAISARHRSSTWSVSSRTTAKPTFSAISTRLAVTGKDLPRPSVSKKYRLRTGRWPSALSKPRPSSRRPERGGRHWVSIGNDRNCHQARHHRPQRIHRLLSTRARIRSNARLHVVTHRRE